MSDVLDVGPDAARRAMPRVPVVTSPHPKGNRGVAKSVSGDGAVHQKILEGAKDWRLREWAGQALKRAGDPKGVRARAQALLDQLRRQTVYVQDPPGVELVQKAAMTLCLEGDRGVCLRAGDCDDLVVAYASAAMSIGIATRTVIQAFWDESGKPSEVYSHILCEVFDEDGDEPAWLKVDPSHPSWPVGQSAPSTREKSFDPMDKSSVALTDHGDFVGVGQIAPDAEELARYREILRRVRPLFDALTHATVRLAAAIDQAARAGLTPDASAIDSLADFPTTAGVWTEGMDSVACNTLAMARTFARYGLEVLRGDERALSAYGTRANSVELFVRARDGDELALVPLGRTADGDTVLSLVPSNVLFFARTGAPATMADLDLAETVAPPRFCAAPLLAYAALLRMTDALTSYALAAGARP
jgi:transglutaminase-like putative cysteine protease